MVTKARADTVRKVIRASKVAREAGFQTEALQIVQEALQKFPKNGRLLYHAAKNLSSVGGRFDEELAAWHACFDRHKEKSQLAWFKTCRNSISRNYRHAKPSEQLTERNLLVEKLHDKARAYLVEPSLKDGASRQQIEIENETSAWISLWNAITIDTVQAYFSYFIRFPKYRTTVAYKRFLNALFKDDSLESRSKYLEFKALIEQHFPLEPNPRGKTRDIVPKETLKVWLGITNGLLNSGQTELAHSILKYLPDSAKGVRSAREMAQKLDAYTTRLELAGSSNKIDFNDPKSILVWSPTSPSTNIIFVFTGAAQRFGFTLPFFHNLLSNIGCHLVYLKDTNAEFYLRGDVWASPSELEDKLKKIQADLGAAGCYMLGSSSGGYAAVRNGIALKASGILSFSLPILSPSDATLPSSKMIFQSLERMLPGEEFDLVKYCANATDIPPTIIGVSELHKRDWSMAERLVGFENIELSIAKGSDTHLSIKEFVKNGDFFSMIEHMIASNNAN